MPPKKVFRYFITYKKFLQQQVSKNPRLLFFVRKSFLYKSVSSISPNGIFGFLCQTVKINYIFDSEKISKSVRDYDLLSIGWLDKENHGPS